MRKVFRLHFWAMLFMALYLPTASADEQTYFFDISQQSADQSLTALATQANITVAFAHDQISTYQANSIRGTYTIREAVAEVLRGTPLSFEFRNSDHLIITQVIDSESVVAEDISDEPGEPPPVLGDAIEPDATSPEVARDDGDEREFTSIAALEEIRVTGRKREEDLTDVPVSISVFRAAALAEQGITSLQDLYDATPGLSYDIAFGDRNSAQPGIRGVQSNEVATTQQKVITFVDGLPFVGQVGSLGFYGVDQVEVYRGPQSAAFGRATFAGAINYITADATEEFEAQVQVRTSSLANNELAFALSGPITDRLGYRVSWFKEDFTGPDEWTATDGTELGTLDAGTVTAKLNFEFSDSAYGEVMYTKLDQHDGAAIQWTLDPADCWGDSGVTLTGRWPVELHSGTWDCDIDSDIPRRNFDVYGSFVDNYDPANYGGLGLDAYLRQTNALGVTHEQLLLGSTIIPGVQTERHRIQGELNFEVGGGLLTFLGMRLTEFYQRWAGPFNDTVPIISAEGRLEANHGGVAARADPTDIDETYIEARWASPEDRRLRYTVSGSYYSYDFHTDVHFNFGAIEYNLINRATGEPVNPVTNFVISKNAENVGVALGLQYDLTDRTTLSIEGRYQSDEVCGEDIPNDFLACETTLSFAPRIAVNTALNNEVSLYAQYSRGTNPAGINIGYANPGVVEALDIANGSISVPGVAPDGISIPGNAGVVYNDSTLAAPSVVSYSADTWLAHKEEKLTNFELGAKGTFADNRGTFAAALYYMLWEDLLQVLNLNWDDDTSIASGGAYDGWDYEAYWDAFDGVRTTLNGGDAEFYGIETTASYAIDDIWMIGGNLTLSSNRYTDYCSTVGLNYATAQGRLFRDEILTPANDGVLAHCVVADGHDLPKSSSVKGAFNVIATLPGDVLGMETTLRADVRHVGPHTLDDFSLFKRPAVTTANVSVNMRTDHLMVRVFVNNVTDEDDPLHVASTARYADNPTPGASAIRGNGYLITPRRPRELGVSASYEF